MLHRCVNVNRYTRRNGAKRLDNLYLINATILKDKCDMASL